MFKFSLDEYNKEVGVNVNICEFEKIIAVEFGCTPIRITGDPVYTHYAFQNILYEA